MTLHRLAEIAGTLIDWVNLEARDLCLRSGLGAAASPGSERRTD